MSVPPADQTRPQASEEAPTKIVRICTLLLVLACLGACAHRGGGGGSASVPSRGGYKVGAPYTIDGVTYTPQEEFNHTETGVASWYGPGFHGKSTANGETYDQSDHTAAHRTLQMPAIVRVTNLDNGRSTVVRVNDRGPYARGRIMDMSRAAAEELGMVGRGTAHVRLDQLPAESQAVKEIAINGGGASEQREVVAHAGSGAYRQAPVMVAATPPPAPSQVPPPESRPTIASIAASTPPPVTPVVYAPAAAASGFYVQAGAFSTMANASKKRDMISSYGVAEISPANAGGHEVYRVRLGPYTTPDAAGIVADRLKRSGYGDARVVAD